MAVGGWWYKGGWLMPGASGHSFGIMQTPRNVRIYLEPPLRESAENGRHNFIARMVRVLESAGSRVEFRDHGDITDAPEFAISHMRPVAGHHALIFRRAYEYPFWQIESCAERWEWDVAQARFDPEEVPQGEAARFYRYWQGRLYGDATRQSESQGHVYVPLQGRLLERRSFQSCSPIQMLDHCLAQETERPVIAGLHPNESYTQEEINALDAFAQRHPRFSYRTGDMKDLLRGCDYVVTQNSAAGFAGYFFGKPLILFGKIDFHHIALRATPRSAGAAFRAVEEHCPDYGAYLWWFWQANCINAGRPEAEDNIRARLRRFGWDV